MSLRTDIRTAIEEVTRPEPDLTGAVVDYVFPREKTRAPLKRRRQQVWSPRRIRGLASIAAALVVVALAGGLMAGGRLWRDLNTAPVPEPALNQTELRGLESRPLNLPLIGPAEQCPVGPWTGTMAGTGLIRFDFGDSGIPTSWGRYYSAAVRIDTGVQGLVLVRGLDLRTGTALVFVGAYTTGRSVGSDDVGGYNLRQRTELAIDTRSRPTHGVDSLDWGIQLGIPSTGSGCIGFQIDGPGFSERVTAAFPPGPPPSN